MVLGLFLIPVKTESFDPNLLSDANKKEEQFYNELKMKVVDIVKQKSNDYDNNLVNQIKEIYNTSQTKPVEERKDHFVKNSTLLITQENTGPGDAGKPKKYANLLNDMIDTLEFMYWELRMAPLRNMEQEKIIRIVMAYDNVMLVVNNEKNKYFKPDTSRDLIKKTIQTLISNYSVTVNKDNMEESHSIPLPYNDETVDGKTTKGIKSLL